VKKQKFKKNLKKCELEAENVSNLGYMHTPEGILQGSDKLKAVQDSEPPKTDHQI
jgi:hypothetical protein